MAHAKGIRLPNDTLVVAGKSARDLKDLSESLGIRIKVIIYVCPHTGTASASRI
jgi:hypothetical protein